MAKADDRWECEHCGRLTKRINFDLELPSCSSACDKSLEEEYYDGAIND